MRIRLGIIVAACLYYSGLVKLARWYAQRSNRNLVILNYHQASGGDLRRQMLYLRRHYRLLHLDDALDELYAASPAGKPIEDRRMPLVLTFDDGYRDNYTHAFPLARELQVPITIFLVPGYIQSGERFWWREGKSLVARAQVSEVSIGNRAYHLDQAGERLALTKLIDARLRYAPSIAERDAFLAMARQLLAVPERIQAGEESEQPLTWEEVREMDASGWVSFGAHTMHHPILSTLADPQEIQHEVEECRTVLERELGHPVRAFAYPIGKPEHFGEHGLRAVEKAGYTWALTTLRGVNTQQSDPHQLRRMPGDASRHWLVMAAETSGIWYLFSHLWKNNRATYPEHDKTPQPIPVATVISFEQN
jgi:peptidoglycan/xylan/chitin deacetylase (PgdA/CDA1 family)